MGQNKSPNPCIEKHDLIWLCEIGLRNLGKVIILNLFMFKKKYIVFILEMECLSKA